MPKGARRGEQRVLGRRDVPASFKDKVATAEAIKHARSRQVAAHTLAAKVADEELTYDIEPRGKYPNVLKAIEYAKAVGAGEILACEYVKQACARFISMGKDARFVFKPEAAQRACNFIETLPHVKGTWKTKTIQLEPWQSFVVCAIFGFYWAHDESLRVTKSVYIEIPRKNAKSTLAAAIGLYMLAEDGEAGAEVYSAATTFKQAQAIFQPAQQMVRKHRALAHYHDIIVQSHTISVWGTLSKFEALHAQGETLDGLNIYCALNDELHAHKTRAVYDVLETAMGSRRNPLMVNVTTAGVNRAGICYEVRAFVRKFLSGMIEEPTWFGVIYTIDVGDDPFDPKVLAKANPNLNVSVFEHELVRLARKAQAQMSALNNYLTKHLNVWVNASQTWMPMDHWDACADPSLKEEDFLGQECMIGLDLASRIDINSKVKSFRKIIDGEEHFYLFARHYLPEDRASGEDGNEETNDQYPGWAREGHLVTTPGNTIDMDLIEDDIREDAKRFKVVEVPFDPYQATQLSLHLAKDKLTMVEYRPTVLNFSEPMKTLVLLVLERRLHHNGDPVLSWMMSNVVVKEDHKDNIFPRKEFPENKIDGAVATIASLARWFAKEEKTSVYARRGIKVVQ